MYTVKKTLLFKEKFPVYKAKRFQGNQNSFPKPSQVCQIFGTECFTF